MNHGMDRLVEHGENRYSVTCLCGGFQSAVHIQVRYACRELSEHMDVELENERTRT